MGEYVLDHRLVLLFFKDIQNISMKHFKVDLLVLLHRSIPKQDSCMCTIKKIFKKCSE